MNMQEYLNNAVKISRQKSFNESDQLTIGEMILKLGPIVENQKSRIEDDRDEATVCYDFGYLFPTTIDSWRGSYDELALDYAVSSYDNDASEVTVTKFMDILKEAVGKEYTGYKGGEFTMTKNTPVWVSNYGEGCNTAVIDIIDDDYQVMIITGHREF